MVDKALDVLVERYSLAEEGNFEHSLKEIIQHLTLLALWRSKFFEHAAFYGGTALRLFYGLRRFSEDLDFSLMSKTADFKLSPHLESIRKELESFGFQMSVEKKEKTVATQIESAFIKGNTLKNLMMISVPSSYTSKIHKDKKLKVKLELDTDPPAGADFEVKTLLTPIPFQIRLFCQPDLFAGKLHAVLCRGWKSRVKGRDLYDYLWYLGNKIPGRLLHLQLRMVQTKDWPADQGLDRSGVLDLLEKKFDSIDFAAAKEDVSPFIRDPVELDLWSREFFLGTLKQLHFV